jgi:alanine dehydrogenase
VYIDKMCMIVEPLWYDLDNASQALHNVTLPHVLALANRGYRQVLYEDPHLRVGWHVHDGCITHRAFAEDLSMPHVPPALAHGMAAGRGHA